MAVNTPTYTRRSQPTLATALALLGKYGTIAGLVLMIGVFSAVSPELFPTRSNLVNILSQISLTAIIAGGLTLPLVVGEFDLSIGSMASLAGVLATGFLVNQHLPLLVAVVAVVLVGALGGLINGLIVTKAGVNALIATLGSGTILTGINYAYSSGRPIALGLPEEFLQISQGSVLGISNTILIMVVVLALLWLLLNQTDVGQQLQAAGGNAEAARLSGIRVDRAKIMAFAVSGTCAALTGLLLASRIGSGQITAGEGYTLDAFAAGFLGSAALRDGEFHVLGTLIGVLTVGVGFNGLAIFGVPTFYQFIFKGGLLIVAVALSTVARRYGKA